MTDLIDCITFIRDQQAKLPQDDLTEAGRRERRKAIEAMAETIGRELPKARVTERWDGAVVSIMGVRATCTAGINGALSNWIAAARRRLDQTHSNGEKENVR